MTGTTFASTAAMPITARQGRRNESNVRDGRRTTGTPLTGGSGDHHYLLRLGVGDRLLSQTLCQDRRGFLLGRARDDRLGGGTRFCLRQPGIARTAGLGRQRLP